MRALWPKISGSGWKLFVVLRRMVTEMTGRKPAPGIPPEEGVAIGSLYWGIGERHRQGR